MKIVTAKELSDLFKVSDSTIYNLAQNGSLPAIRIGGAWRFDLDEIFPLLKEKKKEDGVSGSGEKRDRNLLS